MLKAFTSGESSFPLGYGRKAVVTIASEKDLLTLLPEAINFIRNSRAETLSVVHQDPAAQKDPARAEEIGALVAAVEQRSEGIELELRPTSGGLMDEMIRVAGHESVGTLIVAAPEGGRIALRRRFIQLLNRLGPSGVPILVSRASQPYAEILAPARETGSGELAGRVAIDMASASGGSLTGVAVVGPSFSSKVDTLEDARASFGWLREEAAVQSINVHRKIRRGNPVRVMQELAKDADLVVLAMPPLPVRFFRPGVTSYVAERVGCSTLIVPPIP